MHQKYLDFPTVWTFFCGCPLPCPLSLFPFPPSAAPSVAKAKGEHKNLPILWDKEQLWGALALQTSSLCLQVEPKLLMCLCVT